MGRNERYISRLKAGTINYFVAVSL
uniref:Uncharacterized protein n=1 Tax=Anguilla anguilla TaxID=7936 RepID=A0A0E9QUD6_ANGAN